MGIDPISLIAGAGALISGGGKILGGIAQGNAANYQAQVARNNELIANRNASYAGAAGSARTQQAGLRAAQQFGGVRASLAANNLDVNNGSAADVQVGERELTGLDTATVSHNAALEAYGYKTQASGYEAQSQLDKAQAGQDVWGGIIGGAGSLAGNANQIGGLFGGSSSDGASGAQTFDAGAIGAPSSLIGNAQTLPSDYQWMQDNGSGTIY